MEEQHTGHQISRNEVKMEYKISDKAIAQIVQLFQLGILTGTDVSDQLRTMTLTVNEETQKLDPSEGFVESFNENIQRMMEQAENMPTDSLE